MVDKKDKFIPFISDKRYGGMSENEFLYNGINFAYGENVDIFTNPKGVTLAKDFTDITMNASETISGNVMKVLMLPNDIQSNAYFTDTGKIYIDSWSGAALVHTMALADKKILNAITFSTFVVVFTSWALHKITFTGDDFKTFASIAESALTFTAEFQGFTAADSLDFPVYNYSDSILYRGGGKYLFSTPNTFISVSTSLTLPTGDKIVGLSFLNNNLKIYVNHLNTNSKLFFWNDVSSDHIIYNNRVFKAVTTDGQLDYAVCTDGMYIFSWYQWVKVYDADFSEFGLSWAVNCVPQNLIGIDPYFFYVGYEHKLYKFGKRYTSLKNGVIIDKLFADHITAMSPLVVYKGTTFVATDDVEVLKKSDTHYCTTGYLETTQFYGETMEKIKRVNRIFLAYSLITGESFDIYFSVNGWAYSGTADLTIDNGALKWKEFFKAQLTGLTNHWIKVKIVFKGVTPWTTTPTLYEYDMFEEYIENS